MTSPAACAATPAPPSLLALPPLAVPMARLIAESFAEQLQRSLLGGMAMTRDECTVVATLEGLMQRSRTVTPPPSRVPSRRRRAASA